MPYSRAEILDESIDRLELTVRSTIALRKRFGEHVLVRELAMLSEDHVLRMLRPYHRYASIFVKDINVALAPYQLSLGTKWSEMPPSKHRVVRNPKQMEDHRPSA